METLPSDIVLFCLFPLLEYPDIMKLVSTCRKLRSLCKHPKYRDVTKNILLGPVISKMKNKSNIMRIYGAAIIATCSNVFKTTTSKNMKSGISDWHGVGILRKIEFSDKVADIEIVLNRGQLKGDPRFSFGIKKGEHDKITFGEFGLPHFSVIAPTIFWNGGPRDVTFHMQYYDPDFDPPIFDPSPIFGIDQFWWPPIFGRELYVVTHGVTKLDGPPDYIEHPVKKSHPLLFGEKKAPGYLYKTRSRLQYLPLS